jgi:CubicO group peptidase (beta-lactamase class C family)
MIESKKLDTVLLEIMARWEIPGLGVGIVENGQVAYARGFGVQSLETHTPVTPDSLFCVASVTKCFVATAILQLVEQGRLDLDAPLVAYLPEFRLDDERHRQITLRQVLSHTSGMPDMGEREYDELLAHPEFDEDAPARHLRSLAGRKMIAAPGERFSYSNIGYNVLGVLISRLTGKTFEAAMQENLLRPAGMTESTLFFPDIPRPRLAVPHLRTPEMTVNPVYPYHRADAPASFLHSSVREMCAWSLACLDGGGRILSAAGFERMWTPVAEWGFPPLYEHTGLGWTLGHYEGVRTVSHGGMGFGWTDFLCLLPEKKSAIVILCNEESYARSRTIRAALHAVLGIEPVVDTVSWMIPLVRAWTSGGSPAAFARYQEIKEDPDFYFDADDLLNLAYQMMCAKKFDPAIEFLELNLRVFPGHVDSWLFLVELHLQKEARGAAEAALRKVLELDPGNARAAELLLTTGGPVAE